jgi:hypothetical protein
MKKFMLFALLTYMTACTNPEDRATGDADSSNFNNDEQKVLNSPGERSTSADADSSVAPAVDVDNSKSKTSGTNRPYTPGGDSTRQ